MSPDRLFDHVIADDFKAASATRISYGRYALSRSDSRAWAKPGLLWILGGKFCDRHSGEM